MTKPDEAIRKIIDEEAVLPRLADRNAYLALRDDHPLPVARADLLYLWDDYRGEYLDWATGGTPLGHAHPVVVQAVAEHARYYGFTAPQGHHLLRWPVEYAKSLSRRFTGQEENLRRVLYCEGEREAVRVACDLAMRRTGIPHVAVVGPGTDWLGQTWRYPWDFDPAGALWASIGAVLISPVSANARVIGRGQARRWILAAREAGRPVVYDESRTGFGRLGTVWGQERTGLTADLTVLGGPAGGGWPLGAVIGPAEYFTDLDPAAVSPQAGHPVACCAGAVSLDVLSLGVLEYMDDTVPLLERGLDDLVAQFPAHLTGQHGVGLLRGLRFTSDTAAARFAVDCRAQGLYVGPPVGHTVVLAPALITSTNEMTRGVDLIAATLLAWEDQNRPV